MSLFFEQLPHLIKISLLHSICRVPTAECAHVTETYDKGPNSGYFQEYSTTSTISEPSRQVELQRHRGVAGLPRLIQGVPP